MATFTTINDIVDNLVTDLTALLATPGSDTTHRNGGSAQNQARFAPELLKRAKQYQRYLDAMGG